MTRFRQQEIDIIKKFYPHKGSNFCSKMLNRPAHLIRLKANRMGISITKERQSEHPKEAYLTKLANKKSTDYKVNPDPFTKQFNKNTAYILGLMWADGHIDKSNNRDIRISIKESDAREIKSVFIKTGKWRMNDYQRPNRALITVIKTSNDKLVRYLYSHNYSSKNYNNASIIDCIPKEIKHYWFRGLIDGDGCFFISLKRRQRVFSLSGHYDQDWTFFTNLLDHLNIKYTIQKQITSTGNSSVVSIKNHEGIIRFGEYIYKDYDGIGLSRKYNKYTEIKNKLKLKSKS